MDALSLMPLRWHGMVVREAYSDAHLAEYDAVSDAAEAHAWDRLLALLGADRDHVNAWRLGGTSWLAPLHHAAAANAPRDVVQRLLELGAWRTLPAANGERPVDIAHARGHRGIAELLEPAPVLAIPPDELTAIQRLFHGVIRERIQGIRDVFVHTRMPELGPLTEIAGLELHFVVRFMHGGFTFGFAAERAVPTLRSASWCRVVGMSGRRHEITADRVELVGTFDP